MTSRVHYGDGIPGDDELALIGDVSSGRRVIELGLAHHNSIALARQGAKAIAVDPDAERIGELRLAATEAEVSVECHRGDLGDLGFAPSGTIDVVVSVHTLDFVDDLGRILRQVHRVLKPGAPFICVLDHPFASVGLDATGAHRRYGEIRRTIGDLLAAFDRSNFRVEVFHELGVGGESAIPTELVVKVRKQGS
jgi:SAM-dependent methyltransferase